MKRTVISCAVALVALASVMQINADVARPKPSPSLENRITPSLHTSLVIVPDANSSEARLQISRDTLTYLRAALTKEPVSESMVQRIANSGPRTIIAGLFLFLSVSFAGVWLARSGQRRSHRAVAAVLLCVAVLGAAAIITHANAGPPGSVTWRNLPQALSEGRSTYGGVDIEVVPEGSGIRVIVPLKSVKKPSADE